MSPNDDFLKLTNLLRNLDLHNVSVFLAVIVAVIVVVVIVVRWYCCRGSQELVCDLEDGAGVCGGKGKRRAVEVAAAEVGVVGAGWVSGRGEEGGRRVYGSVVGNMGWEKVRGAGLVAF